MELNKICAAAVIALGALTMACHAGQAVQERRNPQYTMVSRRVMAGETLWEICSKVNPGTGSDHHDQGKKIMATSTAMLIARR